MILFHRRDAGKGMGKTRLTIVVPVSTPADTAPEERICEKQDISKAKPEQVAGETDQCNYDIN